MNAVHLTALLMVLAFAAGCAGTVAIHVEPCDPVTLEGCPVPTVCERLDSAPKTWAVVEKWIEHDCDTKMAASKRANQNTQQAPNPENDR